MGDCCEPPGYGDLFGARFAKHLARRYRKRGLDKTAARLVDFLVAQDVSGATVLEIGGGIGDVQLELLRRGAASATNLELVDAYEADAAALAAEAGLGDRVSRLQMDLATAPEAVPVHDVVVLHRVVCCYPDYQRLLSAAAGRAGRLLVFSHPPRTVVRRAMLAGQNVFFRLRRTPFRTYLHDPDAMLAAASGNGLRPVYRHRGQTWHVVGLASGPG